MLEEIHLIASFNVEHHIFERNAALPLQPLVLFGIPRIVLHPRSIPECVPYVLSRLTGWQGYPRAGRHDPNARIQRSQWQKSRSCATEVKARFFVPKFFLET